MNTTTQSDTLFQMGRISRKLFSARAHGERAPMGNSPIGRTQGIILSNIIDTPNISQDELAAKLQLDKTTIAKAVKKMEINGMITREKSTEDARKYKLNATEKAAEIKEHITKRRDERSSLAFEGIEQAEIEAFKKTLSKIEENIERNRLNMRNRVFEHIGSVIDILIKEDGISEEELFQKLGVDPEKFERLINGLKKRGLAEVKEDKLHASERAKDFKENGPNRKMGHRHKGHGKGRGMHRPNK